MVDDLGMIQRLRSDLFHFLVGQCEVKEILVLCHSFRLCALGQNDYTSLYIPLQNDLGCTLAVLRTDRCQFRISENAVLAFCQRCPCLRLDAEFLHVFQSGCLGKERMQFNLVDRRLDFNIFNEVHQNIREKVGNTDCFQFSFFICIFHRSVGGEVIAHCLMEQIKIKIFQAELFQRCFNSFPGHVIVFHILDPHLGCDEEFFSCDKTCFDRFFDRSTDCFFIHIGSSGIERTVACLNGIQYYSFAFIGIGDLEDTEADLRHFRACIQCDIFHVVSPYSWALKSIFIVAYFCASSIVAL